MRPGDDKDRKDGQVKPVDPPGVLPGTPTGEPSRGPGILPGTPEEIHETPPKRKERKSNT